MQLSGHSALLGAKAYNFSPIPAAENRSALSYETLQPFSQSPSFSRSQGGPITLGAPRSSPAQSTEAHPAHVSNCPQSDRDVLCLRLGTSTSGTVTEQPTEREQEGSEELGSSPPAQGPIEQRLPTEGKSPSTRVSAEEWSSPEATCNEELSFSPLKQQSVRRFPCVLPVTDSKE